LESNLGLQCFDKSIEVRDASAADLESFDGVAEHFTIDVGCKELLEQSRFHAVDLVLVHGFSPVIALTYPSRVVSAYQRPG
jgi:hypothetical protein